MELRKIMNQKELDLNIEVTPEIEDAFYFLRSVETDIPDAEEDESVEEYEKRLSRLCDAPVRAGQRLEKLPFEERMQVIRKAYQMIDNLKKYGIPCAEWA